MGSSGDECGMTFALLCNVHALYMLDTIRGLYPRSFRF